MARSRAHTLVSRFVSLTALAIAPRTLNDTVMSDRTSRPPSAESNWSLTQQNGSVNASPRGEKTPMQLSGAREAAIQFIACKARLARSQWRHGRRREHHSTPAARKPLSHTASQRGDLQGSAGVPSDFQRHRAPHDWHTEAPPHTRTACGRPQQSARDTRARDDHHRRMRRNRIPRLTPDGTRTALEQAA